MQELISKFAKMSSKATGAIEDLSQISQHIKDNEEQGVATPNEIIPINSRTVRKETKMKKTEQEAKFALENPIKEQISNMINSIFE